MSSSFYKTPRSRSPVPRTAYPGRWVWTTRNDPPTPEDIGSVQRIPLTPPVAGVNGYWAYVNEAIDPPNPPSSSSK